MRRTNTRAILRLIVAGVTLIPASGIAQQAPPFSDRRWTLSGDSTRIVRVDGRETLQMESGSADWRDVQLLDGTIDVDLKTSTRRSFVYVNFRIQEEGEQEEFYLRPHKTSLPDAAQYAPVFQGESAWQLYYGNRGTAPVIIPPGVWNHLRIVLSGRRAAFFLNDTITPFMVIPHLAREPKSGFIGLRAYIGPGTVGTGPAVNFSNLMVRQGATPYDFSRVGPEPAPVAGIITNWEAGPAFAAPDSAISRISPSWIGRFSAVPIEPDGFVELHRHLRLPNFERYVGTVARFRVTAAQGGIRRLDLGFSDRVTVFLNGKPIFYRDDSYDYLNRRDGLISFDQASIFLPLRAGTNEVAIVVTDRFGGWAIMGRFPDMKGLTLPDPK